ncbi:Hypothetical predicted protein [Paramuricea clavata]|nr:Hypothetical predicted protein [Paramuricea clavata]
MTTKHLPQNTYKEVASRPKSRNINGNSSSKQDNLKTTAAGPNLVNVLGSNRYSPLEVETADESEQEIISADEARPTSHGRKHDSKTQKSKKTTRIPSTKSTAIPAMYQQSTTLIPLQSLEIQC